MLGHMGSCCQIIGFPIVKDAHSQMILDSVVRRMDVLIAEISMILCINCEEFDIHLQWEKRTAMGLVTCLHER